MVGPAISCQTLTLRVATMLLSHSPRDGYLMECFSYQVFKMEGGQAERSAPWTGPMAGTAGVTPGRPTLIAQQLPETEKAATLSPPALFQPSLQVQYVTKQTIFGGCDI